MSATHDRNPFFKAPRPPPTHTHSSEGSMSLPPMSSLLRHEEQIGNEQTHHQYPPQSLQSHSGQNMHPLHFSERNPSAPIHHLYHPPQAPAYSPISRSQAESVMVQVHPPQMSVQPIQYAGPPQQRRQSKKISQRKADFPKQGQDRVNRSSASLDNRRYEPPINIRIPDQDFLSQSIQHKGSGPSLSQEQAPRESQARAVNISDLLSTSRYVFDTLRSDSISLLID